MTRTDPMTTPLQQQIDLAVQEGQRSVPAELLEPFMRPIQQLIDSSAASKARKVGEMAPDFTLPDALGRSVKLSELLQRGPVVLTFYRGIWCPICNLEVRAYQQALPQLEALGASVVAISPQIPKQSLSMAEKHALSFAVLNDAGNLVARQYGLDFILDEAVRTAHQQLGADLPAYNGDASWQLPIPATFLIDQAGIVRLAFVDPDFTHRLDPSIIIAQLKRLSGALVE
ncbi:peroxiredoxin-like family protein [Ktedonospora formicarum]|uniref:thioredoxin-dependent peroxiredoxin n=1 Tax=Ktedonospora formicarum TaxID=2778364 RepID=A0A8J3IE99_9CHLR|nr:peroxiredoxin-like family protein [Ktedonospora formicarum]GHO51142.1 alkyl hydroperoxide reductase [Ktedonospora formicarum]